MEYNADFKLSIYDKMNAKFINNNSNHIIRLIINMLQINPKKRPSIRELLQDRWLNN
jgi:serine/threonine protein kinase